MKISLVFRLRDGDTVKTQGKWRVWVDRDINNRLLRVEVRLI